MGSNYGLPALDINTQQQSPLAEFGKVLQLKNLMAQSAMQPGQLELQNEQVKQQQIETQQKQLALQNNQIRQTAFTDPNFQKDFKDWQSKSSGAATPAPAANSAPPPDGSAPTSPVQLHPLAQYLADRKGLPMFGPGGALETSEALTTNAQKMAELAKTQGEAGTALLKNHAEQIGNFKDLVGPVLEEKDPVKQQQGIQSVQAEIQAHPQFYPEEATQHIDKLGTIQGLQAASNFAEVRQMLTSDATKQAEASQKTTAAAAPTAQQLKGVNDAIDSFGALPPNLRLALKNQANTAPDYETLRKVQASAETQQNANQMHLDTMANTRAIQGNKFGEAGLTANEKMWTDPQRGFAGALAQANQTKDSIKAGADGNALLTNMVPTMEVLGINHAAGISRISPAEAMAAGTSPDWATRWNAWATKVTTGKLTPELAKEGNQLMDIVTDAAHARAVTSANLIAKGHGLDPSQVPAMNRDGSLTTLDKVSSKAGASGNAAALPKGNGQAIDKATALQFYEAAGHDPAKAAQMARDSNWKVE